MVFGQLVMPVQCCAEAQSFWAEKRETGTPPLGQDFQTPRKMTGQKC